MLNKMKRTLAPPVFEDENKSDLARLLHPVVLALFGATFLFALGIGLLNIFTDAHNRELASVVSAVMSILFGGALVWMRRGHLRMVSVLLTIMLFAGTTWAAYNFHGYRDASATGYFVLIAVAGLLFGGKVTVFYTVVSILTLSGMAYAEVSGYKSFPQPKNQFIQLILLSFNLGMTTVVTRLSTWRHRKALARSLQEIAERKRAEEALREGEERYRSLVEISPDAITVTDLNGKLIMTNQRAAELHGFEGVEELLMQDAFELIALEDRQRAMENVRKTLETGGIRNIEYTLLKKDGTTFTADLSASVIVNAEGKPTAFIGVVRDITDRKLAEEMMIQSEKMLTVGRLAAGMAHEINNPLAGILQNAQVMRNRLTGELPKNQSAAEACGTTVEVIEAYMNQRGIFSMIEAINESGRRAAQIVNNVLSFSRKSESRFIPHDLCELLDRTLELASNDYDLRKEYYFRQIEIVREYDAAVPEIPCEASQIQQVFLNILKNGAQAMAEVKDEGRWTKDEGRWTKDEGRWTKDEGRWTKDEDTPPRFTLRVNEDGDMACIEIEDNGPGMNEATRKRVFEPFFTTKGASGSTGLGMSVSYFIITENHGGTLTIESTLGKGVKFIIRLPLERKA